MKNLSLKIDNETKSRILQLFEKDLNSLKQDVEVIRQWIKSQQYLPETPSDQMIEYFIVNTKFSLENTKRKIEMYYKVRNLTRDILGNTHPQQEWVQNGFKSHCIVPLPKLKDGLYRIVYLTLKNIPADQFDIHTTMAHILNLYEVRMHEDFMFGDIAIFDFQYTQLSHFIKMTPTQVKLCCSVLEKLYSNRMKEIHVINHPPAFDVLLKIAKMFLKPKLFQRIHLHNSMESLLEYIPLEVLPKDYGGQEKSLVDLEELWKLKLKEYLPRFDKLEKMLFDESLIPSSLENNEHFGIAGSFKKLEVD